MEEDVPGAVSSTWVREVGGPRAYGLAGGWGVGEPVAMSDLHGPEPVAPSEVPLDGTDTAALLACRRDPERFGEIFDQHYEAILGYFASRVRGADVAADLCAETFAAALAGVDRFDPYLGSASQWLYGIARHQLHRYWRDLRVGRAHRERLGMEAVDVDDETVVTIGRLDAEASRQVLHQALRQLGSASRQAVELRVLQGLDYEDIAAVLGCRPATARVRVHRGLRRLRAQLEELERV